jgi:hypothetical protein
MINVFDICDEIVEAIHGFQPTVIDRKIVAERAYHYVDGQQVPRDRVSVVVYPMARQKERKSKTKTIVATCYAVIKTAIAPSDKDKLDELVRYGDELDQHLEGRPMCGAKNMLNDDDQFYWFPDILHTQNHFSSLLELRYQWIVPVGGVPTT